MLAWLMRKIGLVKERVHHIEDEFFQLAERFEAAGKREWDRASAAAAAEANAAGRRIAATSAAQKAEANAAKVRAFFG